MAFLKLEDEKAPWPLLPVRTKEQPVNPDPTYPRQHGYAFKGYALDEAQVPTFTYLCGEVSIADRSEVVEVGSAKVLRRTLTFTAPAATTLHLRALVGTIESPSSTVFKTKQVQLTIPTGKASIRPAADPKAESEALVKYALPAGETTHTIDYALLP